MLNFQQPNPMHQQPQAFGAPQGFQQPTFQQPQGNQLAGLFSGIRNAKVSLGASYCKTGRYWGVIRVCKLDQSRKGIIFAAVEMAIVNVIDNAQGLGHRIGEEVSYYTDKSSEYFLSDIKGFIAAATGEDPDSITEEACAMVFGPQNPLQMTTVEWSGRDITTKTGGNYTKISFHREVPASEVMATLPPDMQANFYPQGILQQLASKEQAPAQQNFQAPAQNGFAQNPTQAPQGFVQQPMMNQGTNIVQQPAQMPPAQGSFPSNVQQVQQQMPNAFGGQQGGAPQFPTFNQGR